jgi:hypothetical protein
MSSLSRDQRQANTPDRSQEDMVVRAWLERPTALQSVGGITPAQKLKMAA